MKHSTTLKLWGSSLLMIIASVLIFMFLKGVIQRLGSVEHNWHSYNQRAAIFASTLADMEFHLGYNGLIHHFKNMVLRGEKPYRAAIEVDVQLIRKDAKQLRQLALSNTEKQDIDQIMQTVNEYERMIPVILSLKKQGLAVKEIDHQVYVNDWLATASLYQLRRSITERSQQQKKYTDNSLENTYHFIGYGYWIVALILLLGSILILFLVRISAAHDTLHQAMRQLNDMLEAVPDALLIVEPHGRIMRANSSAERLFGYSTQQMQGQLVEMLMPERVRQGHDTYRDAYTQHPQTRPMGEAKQLVAMNRTGEEFPVDISLNYTGAPDQLMILVAIRDISARQHAHAALEYAKKQAEDALAALKQTQRYLVEREKEAALGELVVGVAHEVNTPMGVALSAATHLRDTTDHIRAQYRQALLTEDELIAYFNTAHEATGLVEANCQRASEIVQNFKRIAVDQMIGEMRCFHLARYLKDIIRSLSPALKPFTQLNIQIQCPDALEITGDPGNLSQIITNLIMNTLLHAFQKDGEGNITITVTQPDHNTVELVFQDDGQGMNSTTQQHIFEPFFTTKRGAGGSGLGMYIVHNIVTHAMHGTLAIDSHEGEGTRITLTFPRILPPSDGKPPA